MAAREQRRRHFDPCLHTPPLGGESGTLKLDHLDSCARSGQAHGRIAVLQAEILAHSRLLDGEVDTDDETAAELTRRTPPHGGGTGDHKR
ncbi:hypothetical protein [uncultured Brachybacterium sp.]|uniref:hypothetical protein n=1 Tax=uncultured Brachybacterium sp. TaxID=189680 RepID=UPI002614D765|nr:hypothetical protein [uncultured Brachybacterium sp.]